MSEDYPDFDSRQRLKAAQQIRQDINTLLASEDRRPALFAAIRNRLRDALVEIEEVIRHYQEGAE